MSITKDFETRPAGCMECGGARIEDVNALLAHTRDLEAMLKKHEWSSVEWDGNYYDHEDKDACPECRGWKEKGHSPDCAIAKLIKGVE